MDLQSLLKQAIGSGVIDKIAQKTGVDPHQVNQVIDAGLPVILGQMAKKTTYPKEAEMLDEAVATDHTGSSMRERLSELFTEDSKNTDGEKILDHVLGSNKDTTAESISNKTGLTVASVAGILTYLAPIIMAQLGKAKQETDMDAGQMADTLQKQTDSDGNPLMDLATSFLDQNKDGSVVDDVLNMFARKKA